MKRVVITIIALIFSISFSMAQVSPSVTVTSEGTVIRGATLALKLDWLVRNAESHNTYIVEVSANENIAPRTLEYRGAINITVILRGDYENRTVRLSSHGTMFTVNSNVTFILDDNITLHGHTQNTGNMVDVNGGIFIMNTGATITENKGGGGVYVRSGTFTMNGGTISNNGKESSFLGGGVDNRANFTMNGGTISGNIATQGGGVSNSHGTFILNNGTISGNSATQGGGVYVSYGTFTMRGGIITGNIAGEYGGGVNVVDGWFGGTFTKTGGTITGYNSDPDSGNVVKDYSGTIARRGHAVWVGENKRKEKNAGAHINLSNNNNENWDQ